MFPAIMYFMKAIQKDPHVTESSNCEWQIYPWFCLVCIEEHILFKKNESTQP